MPGRRRGRTVVVLGLFTIVFVTLTVSAYRQKSATYDEPQHVAAGYTALRLHDYRLDLEHPPLLRLWAALPLLFTPGITLDTASPYWRAGDHGRFAHEFVHRTSPPDRLLHPARFMIVLLGVGLGVLVFAWARALYGFWPAAGVLGLYTVEPNLLAHASLVTTDLGITFLAFGTVYFTWRLAGAVTWGNLIGLTLFFALAQVSKYSALLLGPLVLGLLLVRAARARPWPSRIGGAGRLEARRARILLVGAVTLLLAVAAWTMVWVVYDFRYAPTPESLAVHRFRVTPEVAARAPALAAVMAWVDDHRLLPNAAALGFLLSQAKAQVREAYLAGSYSTSGWWYYFPVAFAVKTPLGVLLLAAAGTAAAVARWRTFLATNVFLFAPIAVFLGAGMIAHLNIGLRHVLPIYPFVLLVGGSALALPRTRAEVALVLAPLALAAVESGRVHPDYLAFFNALAGGPANGHRLLVDSNLDWGQDLKPLKGWMVRHGVEHVNLAYFGTADPDAYAIDCTHLPGAPFYAADRASLPRLPGWVAVSVTKLHGVYLGEAGREFYRPLLERRPDAVIGHSIHVYWVERPWW
jgi:hypothetical protein